MSLFNAHGRRSSIFVDNPVGEGLSIPITVCGGKSICHLLEHTASCYINWLGDFALRLPAGSLKAEGCASMEEGQILVMCRQLGHIPPDTDVSLAFKYDF